MMQALLEHGVAVQFGMVVLMAALFLIARVAKLSQPLSLALALSPMAFALAFDSAILPAAAQLI